VLNFFTKGTIMHIKLVSWSKGKSVNQITDEIVMVTGKNLDGKLRIEQFFNSSSKDQSQPVFSMPDIDDRDVVNLATKGIVVKIV